MLVNRILIFSILFDKLYIYLDRYYWKSFDSINLSESLFAIANLFSFAKFCFLLPVNQFLGKISYKVN
jgi:hypothetical protein